MPFVKEKFIVPGQMPAYLFVMRIFDVTQREAQRMITKGRLLIDDKPVCKPGQKINGETEIIFFKPSPQNNCLLFQNSDFVIFEKPSGILVHPKNMSTPYCLLDEIRHFGGKDANAAHRIDMETSGLLLASKNKKAETYLKSAFEEKTVKKSYLAWVDGKITKPFSVTEAIKMNDDYSQTKHKVFIDPAGKSARTDFKPLYYDKKLDASLLACYPLTGRTHQIRVHLFHVKHPILGDPFYGTTFDVGNAYLDQVLDKKERMVQMGAGRLMLHAQSLYFKYNSDFYIESKIDFQKMKNLICKKEERKFNRES
ncbi:MAG: RluA family pseudouridine synthase [Sulfurovum sp.]|nr:RluA family pseudouridine synthase [Sulfurovum sp.]MDD3602614.1 RluA family pseudouridine synthase [Sulfurovum sp.]